MAKFNLKEHIAKNKATFFGSLTEGQFSWMTQDTGQQIGSQDENQIPVYMFDDKGKYYYENDYEGYGVFGGKDYYELLDQMNGGSGDRERGIDLAFGKEKTGNEILFPALVTSPSNFNYKNHDFTKEPESDPNQSWYEPEEDDFYDQNDEEVFGDMDKEEDYDYSDEEELDEVKTTNTKMKKSEFKDKIKEMVLSEMEKDINISDETPENEEDFLAEVDRILAEADEEVDAEVTDTETADAEVETPEGTEDVEVTDTETEDVPAEEEAPAEEAPAADGGLEDIAANMEGTESELMKNLMDALKIAKGMNNEKLETQIGNTLKFFVSEYIGGSEQ